MSMLAEPRRKQRVVNLRAGNNAWSNDANKFGQRMLERMGWASGKGLGAREDGVATHVVARYKNDERGLGYEERSDQWTQHEDQFNALLADLAGGGGAEVTALAPSGVSLELKSKSSRARVHYHKFTRGKDLARYSDKELANIFGKKSLGQPESTENVPEAKEARVDSSVFVSGGSMSDYFSNKLRALGCGVAPDRRSPDTTHTDYTFCGFAPAEFNHEPELCLDVKNKKKKKKKKDDESCNVNAELSHEPDLSLCINKKKNKKKDIESCVINARSEVPATVAHEEEAEEVTAEQLEGVRKKRKRQREGRCAASAERAASPDAQYSLKAQKTKRKNKHNSDINKFV